MNYAEMILPEFDQEMAGTRQVLQRVPEDKLEWRAHPKSNTVGWNANHLAEIPGWVPGTFKAASWDLAPKDGEPYRSPALESVREILELFDQNVVSAREALSLVSDEAMQVNWSLLSGGEALFTMPRTAVIRRFVLNHTVHHRAILCVYLRLLDVPVPGLYGPSADETM